VIRHWRRCLLACYRFLSKEILKNRSANPIYSQEAHLKFRFPMLLRIAISLFAFPYAGSVYGDVTLPKVLDSHMVVQRDLPVHLWGWATAGESVTVGFRGRDRTTVANDLGLWGLYMPPGAAGGPFQLTVKGNNTITLDDVLVGDVWVAGGQSNMEFEMRKASTAAVDLPKAANDHIRLMIVKKEFSKFPKTDLDGTAWTASTPESAKEILSGSLVLCAGDRGARARPGWGDRFHLGRNCRRSVDQSHGIGGRSRAGSGLHRSRPYDGARGCGSA
jgi:hypothetical protein